jgi:hypothetical protein
MNRDLDQFYSIPDLDNLCASDLDNLCANDLDNLCANDAQTQEMVAFGGCVDQCVVGCDCNAWKIEPPMAMMDCGDYLQHPRCHPGPQYELKCFRFPTRFVQ